MVRRLAFGRGAVVVVTAICVAGSAFVAPFAGARDYTLHMLAHVPTRCSIYRASRDLIPVVVREADEAATVLGGDPGVRIACNVPYAMHFNRTSRRTAVRIGPVAGGSGDDDLGLSVVVPGIDGPLRGYCSSLDLAEANGGCMPLSVGRASWQAAPTGLASFALVAARNITSDASEPDLPMRQAPPAASLRVTVTARY